jgi:hypothetical protein
MSQLLIVVVVVLLPGDASRVDPQPLCSTKPLAKEGPAGIRKAKACIETVPWKLLQKGIADEHKVGD